jgi:pilus assembly protein CpaE
MQTLVLGKNLLEPLACQVRTILQSRVDRQGLITLSFDSFEKTSFHGAIELGVVLLPPDLDRGLDVLRRVRLLVGGQLLAVGPVVDSKVILRALQNGADYYMDQHALDSEFEAALSRIKIKQEHQAPSGRLLAVLSASGGTGASTLAANIACVVAADEQQCGLIDLKAGRGDLAALLDVKPQFTLADLCQNAGRVDRTMFEKMLVRHTSGVHLLGAPQKYRDIRAITPAGVSQGLHLARTVFATVVIDLEDCFHEEQLVALRQATGVLLVTRLEFTSLRNARRILEHLQDVEVSLSRVQIVVNRHGQPNELPVDEAEDALGQKLAHFIPDDGKTVNGANNAGVLVVQRSPGAKVSVAIAQVARTTLDRRPRTSGVMAALGR